MKRRRVGVIVGIAIVIVAVAAGALWKYHEQPQFCSTFCHLMDPYVASWTESDLLAHAHAEADISCLNCHEPTMEQQVDELIAYVKKDYKNPLKKREFDNEWCLRCKEHGTYENLIECTQDYTVNGQPVNPHDPAMDMQATVGREHFDCYNCHEMHSESAKINYCYTCHMSNTFQSCNSPECHEAGLPTSSGE